MSKMKEEMRGRAWRAMLSQAFFSVEDATFPFELLAWTTS